MNLWVSISGDRFKARKLLYSKMLFLSEYNIRQPQQLEPPTASCGSVLETCSMFLENAVPVDSARIELSIGPELRYLGRMRACRTLLSHVPCSQRLQLVSDLRREG
jgi:hypothetical protein